MFSVFPILQLVLVSRIEKSLFNEQYVKVHKCGHRMYVYYCMLYYIYYYIQILTYCDILLYIDTVSSHGNH